QATRHQVADIHDGRVLRRHRSRRPLARHVQPRAPTRGPQLRVAGSDRRASRGAWTRDCDGIEAAYGQLRPADGRRPHQDLERPEEPADAGHQRGHGLRKAAGMDCLRAKTASVTLPMAPTWVTPKRHATCIHMCMDVRAVQVDGYKLRVTTWGSGSPHPVLLPRLSADGRSLAPAALGRSLHWIYKLYCIPLVGRALLRPQPSVSVPFLRHFLVGSARRNDMHFLNMLARHGSTSRDRAVSARAIVWANQPTWWRK